MHQAPKLRARPARYLSCATAEAPGYVSGGSGRLKDALRCWPDYSRVLEAYNKEANESANASSTCSRCSSDKLCQTIHQNQAFLPPADRTNAHACNVEMPPVLGCHVALRSMPGWQPASRHFSFQSHIRWCSSRRYSKDEGNTRKHRPQGDMRGCVNFRRK